ncbi:TauD/TfdA family dioxygenase [Actinokineospora sp. 24-640]
MTALVQAEDAAWAAAHPERLRAAVAEHGAVLVRGLGIASAADVAAVARAIGSAPVDEREGFAPRHRGPDGVYSSAEWPPDQPMCMHHELSYAAEVPGLLLVGCLRAPETGGATAVSDAREVLSALPADLVARFTEVGWQLNRTYHEDIGVPWTTAFGTTEKSEVEHYCRAAGIEYQWQGAILRTRQRRAAVVDHPVTGEACWFNQIAFLNAWTMEEEVREYLVCEYGEDGLPFDTAYGDGSPITEDVVHLINKVYDEATRRAPWRAGDLMAIDNIAMAHSREPYTGDRDMAVVFADPVSPTPHRR